VRHLICFFRFLRHLLRPNCGLCEHFGVMELKMRENQGKRLQNDSVFELAIKR